MTLETIYYITQIIAVAAVVASLVFVGVQIKQQRDDARLAAMRDVHKEWRNLLRYLIENREMNELIWFKARPEGFAGLTPEESLRVVQHCDIFMNYWQETYRLHKSGRLDTAHFLAVQKKLSNLVDAKGGQEVLQALLPDLTEDFRAHLLEIVANLGTQPANEYDRVRDKIVLDAGIRNVTPPHRLKTDTPETSDGADSTNDEGTKT